MSPGVGLPPAAAATPTVEEAVVAHATGVSELQVPREDGGLGGAGPSRRPLS